MEFKNIDSLNITECCEQLHVNRQDLPEVIQSLPRTSELQQLIVDRLVGLLEEDKSAYHSCSSVEHYETYLASWSDGLYRDNASKVIARWKAETLELDFYKKHKNSISGCEEYLRKYPYGKFVKEVKLSLEASKRRRNFYCAVCLLVLIFIVGIYIYSNYVSVSYLSLKCTEVALDNLGQEIKIPFSTDADVTMVSATSSEKWVKCRVSDRNLYISSNVNSKDARNAIVTVTANSSFWGKQLSEEKKADVKVVQKTGYASYIDISESYINLSANEGKDSIRVNSDGIFIVSAKPKWIETSIKGAVLNLKYKENLGVARNGYIFLKSGSKTKRISVAQAGKTATFLMVSTEELFFDSDGGSRIIDVSTDGVWQISTATVSWRHTNINGNTIELNVDDNPGTVRSDYFVVKSGSMEKRINISQTGKSATQLSVSIDRISFPSSGGSKSILVSTDGLWRISAGTASWGHTDISGSTIVLRVDANNGDKRSDYFVVKSGNIEKRINISQESSLATSLSLSKNELIVAKEGTPSGRCYSIDIYTDGINIVAETSAGWMDVDIVGGRLEITTNTNKGRKREANVIIKSDKMQKRLRVIQQGIKGCPNCRTPFGNSTGQVWGVQGYWNGVPQYGWVQCSRCGGSAYVVEE